MNSSDEISFTGVYSSRRRLAWYHWVLIAAQTCGLFICAIFVAKAFLSDEPVELQDYMKVFTVSSFMCFVWYESALHMLTKNTMLEYNASVIRDLKSFKHSIKQEIAYSQIKGALRKSAVCLELLFKHPIPAKFASSWFVPDRSFPKNQYVDVTEFFIYADPDEIVKLSNELEKHGVPVQNDPIPDNDPQKQTAILIGSLIGIVIVFGFTIKFALRFLQP